MARKIEVQIVGDASSLSRAFKSAGNDAKSFGSNMTNAAGAAVKAGVFTATAAGIGAVAIGLRQGIKEYVEAAKVGAQTNAVIKSTGGVANVTAKDIDRLAVSLMRKSGVDDEAIKSGENMLLTFTRVRNEVGQGNDVFTQATKASLDLSVALGKDLPSSAMIVGKALNDPVKGMTAMTRAGIQFTDQQKNMIKSLVESGDMLGAQKIILKELETQFGGSAKAAGETLPGQLAILKESFNNFAGDLVAKAMPGVQRFVDFLNTRLIPAEGFTATLKVAWQGVSEVAVGLWGQLETAIMGETRMIAIPTEKRVEFVEVEGLAAKLKEQVRASIAAIDWSDVLITVGAGIGKGVLQLQQAIWQFLFTAWKTAWSMMLTEAGSSAAQLAGAVTGGMANLRSSVTTTVLNAIRGGVTAITTSIPSAYSAAMNLGSRVVAGVSSTLGRVGAAVMDKLEGVIRSIAATAVNAFSAAVGIGSSIISGVVSGLAGLAGRVAGAIAGGIRAGIAAAGGRLRGSGDFEFTRHTVGEPLARGIVEGATDYLKTHFNWNLSQVLGDALDSTAVTAAAGAGGTDVGKSLKGGVDDFLEAKLPDNLAQVLGLAFDQATADFSAAALGVTWSTPTLPAPLPSVGLGPSRLADPDARTNITVVLPNYVGDKQDVAQAVRSELAKVSNRQGTSWIS